MKTSKKYETVVETLKQIMELYHKAMEMSIEDKERLILKHMIVVVEKSNEDLSCIKKACERVLNHWQEGFYPHDSTLIDEVLKLVDFPYTLLFPRDDFDKDMVVYRLINSVIQSKIENLRQLNLDKLDQSMIEQLWRSVNNTLVNNPNFKGKIPYYKRNYTDYCNAKKLWLELLDRDFEEYIEYFQEQVVNE